MNMTLYIELTVTVLGKCKSEWSLNTLWFEWWPRLLSSQSRQEVQLFEPIYEYLKTVAVIRCHEEEDALL